MVGDVKCVGPPAICAKGPLSYSLANTGPRTVYLPADNTFGWNYTQLHVATIRFHNTGVFQCGRTSPRRNVTFSPGRRLRTINPRFSAGCARNNGDRGLPFPLVAHAVNDASHGNDGSTGGWNELPPRTGSLLRASRAWGCPNTRCGLSGDNSSPAVLGSVRRSRKCHAQCFPARGNLPRSSRPGLLQHDDSFPGGDGASVHLDGGIRPGGR